MQRLPLQTLGAWNGAAIHSVTGAHRAPADGEGDGRDGSGGAPKRGPRGRALRIGYFRRPPENGAVNNVRQVGRGSARGGAGQRTGQGAVGPTLGSTAARLRMRRRGLR